MLTFLQSCGEPVAKGGPVEGYVLEEGTRTPLSEAIVVATWRGTVSSLADSSGVCFHVESTTTNEKGRFYIPTWKKQTKFARSREQFVDVVVYKSGYQWPEKVFEKGNEHYLAPAKGTMEERLAYLKRLSGSTGCPSSDKSEKNILILDKALYEEAKQIAVTKKGKKLVETLLFGIESLEFDSNTALERMIKRREANK